MQSSILDPRRVCRETFVIGRALPCVACLAALWVIVAAASASGQGASGPTPSGAPIRLTAGPHLFLDEYLIEASWNVSRQVNQPQRDLGIPNPIITGKEDHCFQPYISVVRDPQTGRFRMWYGAYGPERKPTQGHLGYVESDDGIHWAKPHRVLDDPAPLRFGASVIDEGPDFPDPAKRFKYAWWNDGGLKIAASPDGATLALTSYRSGGYSLHTYALVSNAWSTVAEGELGMPFACPSFDPADPSGTQRR